MRKSVSPEFLSVLGVDRYQAALRKENNLTNPVDRGDCGCRMRHLLVTRFPDCRACFSVERKETLTGAAARHHDEIALEHRRHRAFPFDVGTAEINDDILLPQEF